MERPDLTDVDPAVRAYIQWLEEALLTGGESGRDATAGRDAADDAPAPVPSEPETTIQVISVSRAGLAKRTPRHFYTRQRRGGMGVFDIELPETDEPAFVSLADVEGQLLILTNVGRAYRLPVSRIPETEVRGRGQAILAGLKLGNQEQPVAILPADAGRQVALVSERGWVRLVDRAHLGANLINGMRFHDPAEGGPLAAACWLAGDEELLIATTRGQALRFQSTQVPGRRGRLGARLNPDDVVADVAAVDEASGVFLLGDDGKGTVRLMSGFRLTRTPGSGTKAVLKCERLLCAAAVLPGADIFIISALGKIIRFAADEIPTKEGLVQGVNCMALRADSTTAGAIAAL